MNVKSMVTMSFLASVSLYQPSAQGAQIGEQQAAKQDEMKLEQKAQTGTPFGYASNAAPDRVVTIVRGKTKYLNVKRLETLRITDGVSTVTWTFDTLGLPIFPLAEILPGASGVTVYVDENPMYTH